MSTSPVVPTPAPSFGLTRNERNNRRRTRTGATTASASAGASVSSVSTKNNHRVSSIHLSPPPISDRDSSLYSHRVYASPAHDWSKSCNDLSLSPKSALGLNFDPHFSPFSINNNATPKAESKHGNGTSLYNSRSLACLHDNIPANSAAYAWPPKGRWHRSTIAVDVDVDFAIAEYVDEPEPELEIDTSAASSTARHSPLSFDHHSAAYTYASLFEYRQDEPEEKEKKKWYRPFWKVKDQGSKNKKSRTMSDATITPVVPPRSALRSVPPPRSASLAPEVLERGSSLYGLPLGPGYTRTPSLSSGSDEDVFDDATTHLPAGTVYRSPVEDKENDRGFFGRNKLAVERDPLKVRDGREAKTSPSGVYTPPTFPGACGPRPSHFPSHVYTPQNFQLYPTPSLSASAGPSRSASTSSRSTTVESDSPQTPISPTLRVFGTKAMAGLRRMSGQIASYSPTYSNSSARDSYFSYTSTSSRQSTGPVTPTSAHFPVGPAGLGVGLTEKDGVTLASFPLPPTGTGETRARAVSTFGVDVDGSPVPAVKRAVEAPKVKRKPVPDLAEGSSSEDDNAVVVDTRRSVHAL